MVVEHVFVTTLDATPAMQLAANMLREAGYTLDSLTTRELRARRGTGGLMNHTVAELPHNIHMTFDRGRVTLAVAIQPRGGQDMNVHGMVGAAVAKAVEQLLVHGSPPQQCVGYLRHVDTMAGKPWPAVNKVTLGCLIALGGILALGILIAVIAAASSH